MEAYLNRIDNNICERVKLQKENAVKTKKNKTYLHNVVKDTLRSSFDNTMYPTVIEKVVISNGGHVRKVKPYNDDPQYDHSMESSHFHRECREELAYDIENSYKSKDTNELSDKDVNSALNKLHKWIQNAGMAHKPLSEKVFFLEELLKCFKLNSNPSFFKNIMTEIVALKGIGFMNNHVDQNIVDEVTIQDFLIKRFFFANPIDVNNKKFNNINNSVKDRLEDYLKSSGIENYKAIVQATLTNGVVDGDEKKEDLSWNWGDNDRTYTIQDVTNEIEKVAIVLNKMEGENAVEHDSKIPLFAEFNDLDREIIENEMNCRKTVGRLHPVIFLTYLKDLEKYKKLFFDIKSLSYSITTSLNEILINVVKGLIIEEVQIFNIQECDLFLKEAKLNYYNIDRALNSISKEGILIQNLQMEEKGEEEKSSKHWTAKLRDDTAELTKLTEKISSLLSSSSNDITQGNTASTNVNKNAGKKVVQYWGIDGTSDESNKINIASLKIPGLRKTREKRRGIIDMEWKNEPIDFSKINLDEFEEGFEEEDVHRAVLTHEELFTCIKDKPAKSSPIAHLVNHHWNNLFLNVDTVGEYQVRRLIERFVMMDEEQGGYFEDEEVAEFIKDVNEFAGKKQSTEEEEEGGLTLNKMDLIKYFPKAITLLPTVPHEEPQDNVDKIMSEVSFAFVDAIVYGVMYELCELIWPKYDKDDSGTISAKEMSKMLKVEAALYESVEVCELVVASIDENDGDNEISLYEISNFLHSMAMMAGHDRETYQNRGGANKTLMLFSETMLERMTLAESYDYVSETVRKRKGEQIKSDNEAIELHKKEQEQKEAEQKKIRDEQLAQQAEEEAEAKRKEEEEAEAKRKEEEEAEAKRKEEEEAEAKRKEEEEAEAKRKEEEEAEAKRKEEEEAEAKRKEEEEEAAAKKKAEEEEKAKQLNPGDTIWLKDVYGRWDAEDGYERNQVFKCTFNSKKKNGDMNVTLHDENDEEIQDMVEDEMVLAKDAIIKERYRIWIMNPERDGWEENTAYQGIVNSILSDGKFEVTFDDGEHDNDIELDEIIRFQEK